MVKTAVATADDERQLLLQRLAYALWRYQGRKPHIKPGRWLSSRFDILDD